MNEGTLRKVFLIAWREFRHTVLTKSFLFGAIGFPVIILVCMTVVPALLISQLEPLKGTIAIVEQTGDVADAFEEIILDRAKRGEDFDLAKAIDDAGLDGEVLGNIAPNAQSMLDVAAFVPKLDVLRATPSDDLEDLKERAREGELVAVAVVPEALLEGPDADVHVDLTVPESAPPRHIKELEDLIGDAVVHARVATAGKDLSTIRAMLRTPSIEMRRLGAEGDEREENMAVRSIVPMFFMILIWIATFTSGNYLLTSTIEEKSNKVIEVVLSAVGPLELLWGKILGLSAVAGIIVLMYGGLAIAALVAFAMTDILSWPLLLWSAFFLVVAYFTIASLMVAVGSAVSDLREAQSLIMPVMMLLMVPFVLFMPISENPNGAIAVVCSFIPPIQPFAMVMRLAATSEPIPTWQLAASALVGVASVFAFVWGASRIFRVGILMQGKPPSPIELLRWIRRA